ncbi:MAG: MCE family protein [Acidobacteria bacterium]|nr:MCE family protein [Acidobacteriota bacterium]
MNRKSDVRISGVRVGKVKEIRLKGDKAELVLSLDPDIKLHAGASARIVSLGMLGDKYVEVLPGNPNAPPLSPGTALNGTAPPSFDEVLKKASNIGDDVKQVTFALRQSIGGQQGAEKLDQIIENVRELTASLKDLVRANRANVGATTANFRDFSAELKEELPQLADKIAELADALNRTVEENRPDLHDSLSNIRDLTARLKVTANNLNAITTKIAEGKGSVGKLINDETTVDNVNSTLKSIQGGVKTLQNTVGRFERYHLNMTLSGESLPNVSESRSTFGFDLWTNHRRFFRVEYVDPPFGRLKTKVETVTTDYSDGRHESYTITSTKLDKYSSAFNVQMGYRLLPNTIVRAGLFESRGGVGIDQDVTLFHHPVRLTLEAWDFSRQDSNSPHIRFESRFFLNRNMFLTAGWDDPTYAKHSSVLFGAGLTWTDEDMKYMLGLAGKGF